MDLALRYTAFTVYTVYTLCTIQTALHCSFKLLYTAHSNCFTLLTIKTALTIVYIPIYRGCPKKRTFRIIILQGISECARVRSAVFDPRTLAGW